MGTAPEARANTLTTRSSAICRFCRFPASFACTSGVFKVEAGTIRVGTDGSSLTAEQLASIAYVNAAGKLKPMTLSSDGYLRPPPKGTKLFLR